MLSTADIDKIYMSMENGKCFVAIKSWNVPIIPLYTIGSLTVIIDSLVMLSQFKRK